MDIDYAGFSIQGKSHKFNDDRYQILGGKAPLISQANRSQMFAVFDGMNSAHKGAEAAQQMCDALVAFFEDSALDLHPGNLMKLLNNANLAINNRGDIEEAGKTIGVCTGTVAWIINGVLRTFHVGNTLGLLLRADYECDDEYERLTSEKTIGDHSSPFWSLGETVQMEGGHRDITKDDILILVSDGVLQSLDLKTITKKVRKWIRHSMDFAAKSLCELAESRGSTDDITTVIVKIIKKELIVNPNNIFIIDAGNTTMYQLIIIFFCLYIIMLDNDYQLPSKLTFTDIGDMIHHLKGYDTKYLEKSLKNYKESGRAWMKLDFFEIKVAQVQVEDEMMVELKAKLLKKEYNKKFDSILKMAQKICNQKSILNLGIIN